MNHSLKTRLLSLLLAVVMAFGVLPLAAFATESGEEVEVLTTTQESSEAIAVMNSAATANGLPENMTLVTDKESTLAPGITQREIVLFDKNGDRVVMFVAEADLSVDTVGVYANYKDNQNVELGMSKTTEQVAAAEAKHEEPYSVVVAINASYYNMTTGKPTGTFVMEGNDITTESEGNAYSFFAILKDGTPIIGARGEYSSYKGQIAEAVGGYHHIVKDGAVYTDGGRWSVTDTKKYPRQTVGITEDGRVIIMSADGNQAPSSIGLTMLEQAEVMLSLGCVEAVHLDGGGSMTYCSKPEGADKIQILNSPSDGSERSVSNSLMIVSTAAPDGQFHHSILTAENEYVTPGSTVTVSAIGVDAAGGSAEIPADISWKMADDMMGAVADGVFTSSGTPGDAVVQMVYNDKVVGEVTIHVVIPETLKFDSSQITVPYGKTVDLGLSAFIGVNEIVLKPSDVAFTLSDNTAGAIDGFNFTACAEEVGVSGTEIVATLVFDNGVTTKTNITLGRGSQVIYDFEDGETSGLIFSEPVGTKYNYVFPESTQWVVTDETGKVHSGDYAMAAKVNYGNSLESGYMKTSLVAPTTEMYKNATQVGMWLYIPDEAVGLWARWTILTVTGTNDDGTPIFGSGINGNVLDGGTGGTGSTYQFDESGWHYLSIDTSAYSAVGWKAGQAIMQFYICDRDGAAFNYKFAENHNINGMYTFYMDDITVDYSSAVDDRDAPIISSVTYANVTMADAVELNGQTSTDNTVTFAATVADKVASNTTGLDVSTAKAYVDGNLVNCTYTNGKISTDSVVLADGVHSVKFSICDKQGNYVSEIRTITIDAGSEQATIKVVPHDATLNRILLGSVYYVDVVATNVESVESVTTTLDLDSLSVWNLDHMDVADGFTAEYTIVEDENIATITITRTGDVTATGEAVLVSMPIRTWELKTGYTYPNGTKQGQAAMTYSQFKAAKEFWPIFVDVEVDCGLVTFTDGTTGLFSGTGIEVSTEMWANYGNMTATTDGAAYFNSWNGGHIHTPEAMEDKAATCTENGYTGRTFCAVCNSVVDWGTTVNATGHSYEIVDGVLQCVNGECGKLYNGIYEDVEYVDGVACEGWIGESYYVAGKKLTGIQKVAAPDASGEFYYDFGEDGVCANLMKYTGLVHENEKIYYSKMGALASSWQNVDGNWYYFKHNTFEAVTGVYNYYGVPYTFDDNGVLIKGAWVTKEEGVRYYYVSNNYYFFTWQTIDGVKYFFDGDGYRMTGFRLFRDSTGGTKRWHQFTEDGAFVCIPDGVYYMEDAYWYFNEGIREAVGLIEVDGAVYYTRTNGLVATGKYYVGKWSSEELKAQYPAGYYYFDETGKMISGGIAEVNGVKYYVVNNVPTEAGLVEIDGAYYYAGTGGKLAIGKCTISQYSSDELAAQFPAGVYYFGEDGKMVLGGIVTLNDGTTRYVATNGKITAAGLIEVDGDLYYARTNGVIAVGKYYITRWSDAALKTQYPEGYYYFDESGKLTRNGFVTVNDVKYYVAPNGKITAAGLVEVDGEYYYARTNGVIATGKYYVTRWNSSELKAQFGENYYYFDENGKMIRNGFVTVNNAKYYVGINGKITAAGLVEVDGEYYYARTNGLVATGKYYVGKWSTDTLRYRFPANFYQFDEEGKMIR